MRIYISLFCLLFLIISSSAYAQELGDDDPALTDKTLIPDARQGDIKAQFRLGQIYKTGDKGAKYDRTAAYFWFSICEYTTSDAPHVSSEEMQKIRLTRKFEETTLSTDQLSDMIIKYQYQKNCDFELKGLRSSLTASEISSADPFIEKWKESYPLSARELPHIRPIGADDPALNDQTLIPKARQGDTQAQATLVQLYMNGLQGAKANYVEAYFWYLVYEYSTSDIPDVSTEEMKKLLAAPGAGPGSMPADKLFAIHEKYRLRKIYGGRFKEMNPRITAIVDPLVNKWKEDYPFTKREKPVPSAQEIEAQNLSINLLMEIGQGNADIQGINALLQKGADPNVMFQGQATTALIEAAGQNRADIVEALLKAGANPNFATINGQTALSVAARKDAASVIPILARYRANLEARDNFNTTPLMEAARTEKLAALQALLQAGANANAVDEDKTVLIQAVQSGNAEIVKALISAGADVNSKNIKGTSIIDSAIARKQAEIAHLLANAGAKTDTPLPPVPVVKSTSGLQNTNPPRQEAVEKGKPVSDSVQLSRDAQRVLNEGTTEEKDTIIQQILANPQKYNPVAFSALAQALSKRAKYDEAAFWSLVADLRMNYDRRACKGKPDLMAELSVQASPTLMVHTQQIKEAVWPKVLEWDRKTSYDYDHRWLGKSGECLNTARLKKLEEDNRKLSSIIYQILDGKSQVTQFVPQRNVDITLLTPKAGAGDPEAQFQLSQCYASRMCNDHRPVREPREDYPRMEMEWLSKSAAQGYAPAVTALAGKYFSGEGGLAQDRQKAWTMWQSAADAGYKQAYMGIAGAFHRAGNLVEAYAWMKLSEDYGVTFVELNRIELEVKLSDSQLAEAQVLAEKYHQQYFKK